MSAWDLKRGLKKRILLVIPELSMPSSVTSSILGSHLIKSSLNLPPPFLNSDYIILFLFSHSCMKIFLSFFLSPVRKIGGFGLGF